MSCTKLNTSYPFAQIQWLGIIRLIRVVPNLFVATSYSLLMTVKMSYNIAHCKKYSLPLLSIAVYLVLKVEALN